MPRNSLLLIVALATTGHASAQPVTAGTATHGGSVPGASVIHVTSLGDSGLGTLRAAIQTDGPRVIVFDVAGIVHLASDLKVSLPDVTIAGQTAPDPGIVLTGASLRLRANNIVLQHLAVRPGPSNDPKTNDNRDSLSIGGGTHPLHDIRVENVSLSWSVDENADIGGGTKNVIIRNSIIAEALRNAGHPKGRHSMGMLINGDNQNVAVTGNLFASNMFRNPVVSRGGSIFVGYNLITNPGNNAIHFYDAATPTPLKVSVIGNVMEPGQNTTLTMMAVTIPFGMARKVPNAEIYLADNKAPAGRLLFNLGWFGLAASPPVAMPATFRPPADVRASALQYAGARPAGRDTTDKRIMEGARTGTGRVIDNPAEVGGLVEGVPVEARADVPASPFSPSRIDGMLRIEAWLCERHLEVGGPATPECPRTASEYRNGLGSQLSLRR